MTYHLEPWVRKIVSPVILIFPDGGRGEYGNGEMVVEEVFPQKYRIKEIRAAKDNTELVLESPPLPDTTFF